MTLESDASLVKKDYSFIAYHFGTDLQIGSWCILLSSLLFLAVSGYYVYVGYVDYDDDFTQVNLLILFLSSVLFVIASILFVYASYPKELMKLAESIQTNDASTMSCTEKYFTHNYFLISMWILVIAILPVFVYVIWAYQLDVIDIGVLVFFLIAILVVYGALSLWLVSTLPASLALNNGTGSTYFLDFFCCFDYMFDNKQFVKKHLSPDFLAGAWIFAILIAAGVVFSIYLLYEYYESPDLWIYILFFVSSLILSVGALLFVYGSYPGNLVQGSNIFWQLLCCQDAIEPSEEDFIETDERRTLLPDDKP